ncbi:hypothetical protein D0466_09710 [Peribacillus glennii]|uniref:Alpha/beta hydrolase n=1 Tax=Peribacillus glennii TaxID=2303991 RepID=A0A372LCL8_9BACI|nr:hypothetical protein D0466_09710 [Peribacillus glennii]
MVDCFGFASNHHKPAFLFIKIEATINNLVLLVEWNYIKIFHFPHEFGIKIKEEDFPQATVHVIPDAGHFINVEEAATVCRFVNKHFNKNKLVGINEGDYK